MPPSSSTRRVVIVGNGEVVKYIERCGVELSCEVAKFESCGCRSSLLQGKLAAILDWAGRKLAGKATRG